jgi:hypothetical protein
MTRPLLVVVAALVFAGGCGASQAPNQSGTGPSRQALDQRDARALARQVNTQVTDRVQFASDDAATVVQAQTSCTKQSDTAYKCLTSFLSPSGLPDAVTDVTCDRNGGSCITETRP